MGDALPLIEFIKYQKLYKLINKRILACLIYEKQYLKLVFKLKQLKWGYFSLVKGSYLYIFLIVLSTGFLPFVGGIKIQLVCLLISILVCSCLFSALPGLSMDMCGAINIFSL